MKHDIGGVKCRACSEPLNITGVICEKESKPYHIDCLNSQFKCNDGTCILPIYKCDLENECFDGSDEMKCLPNRCNTSYQIIMFPYIQPSDKKSMDIEVPLFVLCDGIYSNVTFNQEKDACFKHNVKPINIFNDITTPFNGGNFFHFHATRISKLYLGEKRLCLKNNNRHIKIDMFNDKRRRVSLLNGQNNRNVDHYPRMDELCRVGSKSTGCMGADCHAAACRHYVCPGMFKCHHHYCIYMSHVCDEYYDGKEADDEMFCPVTSCPGLLKCRGESRCVSKEEIWDNTVNCLQSMDDEIDCHTCPVSCECNGYNIECHLNNSLYDIIFSSINYIKGLMLTGVQQQLYVHTLHIRCLLYINALFCEIEKIVNVGHEDIKSFILFADFKYNKLVVIEFLVAVIFKNIPFLDLSFNKLTSVKNISSFFMTSLMVLSISGYPLKAITFNTDHVPMLTLIDMIYIYNYIDLDMYITRDLHIQIQVKVSDSIMCCMLHKNIKCTSNARNEICTGLMSNRATRAVFYFLSAMTLSMSLFAIKKHCFKISQFRQNSFFLQIIRKNITIYYC